MAGLVQLLGDVPWCEAVTLKTLDGGIGLGVGEGEGGIISQHHRMDTRLTFGNQTRQ